MKQLKIFLVCSILITDGFAQIDSSETEIANQNILEDALEENEESDILELLEELEEDPVNINTANINEMLVVPFMDVSSAELIYNYRIKTGQIFSLAELYNIKGLNNDIIRSCLPYLSIGQKVKQKESTVSDIKQKNYSLNLRTRYFSIIKSTGNENEYAGTQYKSYNRIKASFNNFVFGFISEKDAGESNLMDFSSWYAGIKNWGKINNLIIGNYLLEFGQGLSLWRPYGFSKGAGIINPAFKKDKRVIPYTSTDENNFFRGGAADIKIGNFDLLAFYSNNSIDANIDSVSGVIKTLGVDGYHRTETEISKKNSLTEISYGGRIDFSYKNFLRIGLLSHAHEFNHKFESISAFKPSGDNFLFNSLSYSINISGLFMTGEAAQSGKNIAAINTVHFNPVGNIDIVLSARYYPEHYISFHTFAFGENSGSPQNEIGFYTGLQYKSDYGTINIYYDQFKFPAESFYNPFPLKGNEVYFNYSVRFFKSFTLNARYKNELKEISGEQANKLITVERTIKSYRAELVYNVFSNLRLKGRFDFLEYFIPSLNKFERGYSFFQDISFSIFKRVNVSSRIVFFQTDSYNSRIYEYENDVEGVMYNPALYENGYRFYLLLKYNVFDYLKLSFKYSETNKPTQKIDSGEYYRTGFLDNRVSFQLEIIL